MVAYADLVLPDTTYLERHDVMSMLDRPISEFDGPVDSVRIPVVPPKGQCKPFQEVLIELGSRLKLPAFVDTRGAAQVQELPGLHHQLRDRTGLGHRLPRRLARQGRREVHERRAEPEPVADVRKEQLRVPLRAAQVLSVHAQLEQGLPRVGAASSPDALCRTDPDPHLFRQSCSSSASPRRARPRASSRRRICASASRPISIRCRSTTNRSRPS